MPKWIPAINSPKVNNSLLSNFDVTVLDRTNKIYLGFDTETTGLRLLRKGLEGHETYEHWSYPYMICFVDRDENEYYFEFAVDPKTRKVKFDSRQKAKIMEIIRDPRYIFVGHNIKFDVRALSVLFDFPDSFWVDFLRHRCDDTIAMLHILDSSMKMELKPAAFMIGDYPETDEKDLKTQVDECRKHAPSSWKIANLNNLPYLSKAPTRGWYILDTWLPQAMYKEGLIENFDNKAMTYCGHDCRRTLLLHDIALRKIRKCGLLDQYERSRNQLWVTYEIENCGLSLLPEELHRRGIELQTAITDEVDKLRTMSAKIIPIERASSPFIKPGMFKPITKNLSFNPASPQQVARHLFQAGGLKPKKLTDSGAPSTDIESLEHHYSSPETPIQLKEFIGSLLRLSKIETTNNYRLSYVRNTILGMLLPSLNPYGTSTTRMTSSDPSGQNVSKGKLAFEILKKLITEELSLRSVFGPKKGREWYTVDYVQLQLVIFAIMAGDKSMIDAVKRGVDFHDFMTRQIFNIPDDQKPDDGQRRIGKNVDFGYIFGAGEAKINRTAKMEGLYSKLKELFPSTTDFIARTKKGVELSGTVHTAGMYPLSVPKDKPFAGVNYIVQGCEGELVKLAMLGCADYLRGKARDSRIAFQVHDEIIFDFPKGHGRHHIQNLCDIMCSAGSAFGFPVQVDVKYIPFGESWDSKGKVEVKKYHHKYIKGIKLD